MFDVKMKVKLSILISLAFAFSITSYSCFYRNDQNSQPFLGNMLSIQDIRTRKAKPGIYGVEGFVIKLYFCPPCDRSLGIGCAPCRRGNSVVISAENKTLQDDNLSENEVLLHTNNPDSFETGKRYFFRIEITDGKLQNDPELDFIKIIDYRLLK